MIKTQKRPNTEPQGTPEADDRFFGKVIQFSTISMKHNEMQQHIHTHTHMQTHTYDHLDEFLHEKDVILDDCFMKKSSF